MKIYVVKKGVIMSDDHEVNREKEILLYWLILFGRKEVTMNEIVYHEEIDSMNMHWFTGRGLLSENTKTDIYRYSLTNKAMDLLKKGENNEQ